LIYVCALSRCGRREAHGWVKGTCALSKRLVKCRLKVPAWARKNRCHSRQMTFRRATGPLHLLARTGPCVQDGAAQDHGGAQASRTAIGPEVERAGLSRRGAPGRIGTASCCKRKFLICCRGR